MAILQIVDSFVNGVVDDPQVAYTAPATQNVLIESFTAANLSNVNASYKAYIVSATGTDRAQIPLKVVVWGENDLGIGIVNQVIPKGGTLKLESSATNSIFFTATGRTIDS